jgi:hypothetical protein
MKYDSTHQWLTTIERQGYLKNFIFDFARQDPLLAYVMKLRNEMCLVNYEILKTKMRNL